MKHQPPYRTLSLSVLGLFLVLSSCGQPKTESKPFAESPPGPTHAAVSEDTHLTKLAFEGEVFYKPYGNHTSRYTIKVADQETPFGKSFSLFISEVTPFGACKVYTVYDLKTQTINWAAPFGNPSCTVHTATMGEKYSVKSGEAGFREKLSTIYNLVDDAKNNSFTPSSDKEKLAAVHEYLKSTLYPR